MCTEVKHGPSPEWEAKVSGEFSCRIVGHYTDTHDLVAAGVAEHAFQSHRDEKKMAELLGLRTAFLSWFFLTYQELGGTNQEAIEEVEYLVNAYRDNKKCVVTETGQELVGANAQGPRLW